MIQKVSSLIIADHVLNLIINDDRSVNFNGFVKTFNNGREQGYTIFSGRNYSNNQAIAFAQDRNSDMIVVFRGLDDAGYPTCRGEQGRKDFQPNDFNNVVGHIFMLLEKINK